MEMRDVVTITSGMMLGEPQAEHGRLSQDSIQRVRDVNGRPKDVLTSSLSAT